MDGLLEERVSRWEADEYDDEAMARNQLTASAGEHYVAFRLSQLGFVVGMPRGGSPAVDLLVANATGSKTLAIQVKTTEWAMRQRGRGKARQPHHVEFPLGHAAAIRSGPRFLYVFVDLQGLAATSCPEVYVVPSSDIVKYCQGWATKAKLVRWHESIANAAKYKGNWATITKLLS